MSKMMVEKLSLPWRLELKVGAGTRFIAQLPVVLTTSLINSQIRHLLLPPPTIRI